MESYGYTTYVVGLTDPALARFPVLILGIVYAVFFAMKLAPDKCLVPSTFETVEKNAASTLTPLQEKAGVIIFFGSSVALMFASKLGLATWEITCIGGLLIVLFGILKKKAAIDAMGVSMALVIAGSLSLAGALSSTGAGEMIGGVVSEFAHSVGGNSYIIGAIFFIFPFILTQFMLNRATMLIFHPIAIATAASLGADPRGLMILVQAACLAAFMTPMANGTVPVIMAYGGYTQKSLIKQGFPIGIVIGIVSVIWTMTVFPAFPVNLLYILPQKGAWANLLRLLLKMKFSPHLRDLTKHILRDLDKIMCVVRQEALFVVGEDEAVVDERFLQGDRECVCVRVCG